MSMRYRLPPGYQPRSSGSYVYVWPDAHTR